MDGEIKYMIFKLKENFEGSPWYGDSMMEKIESIDYKNVNNSTATFTNSVAKLIRHVINWRVFALRKIKGDTNFDIVWNGEDDWLGIEIVSKVEWNSLIEELRKTQEELLMNLSMQSDEILDKAVPGRNYSYRYMIDGVIQHDIYHFGQIGLMSKLKSEGS